MRKGYPARFKKVMHGNEAVAWGTVLSRPKVFSVYPITPQTTIPEKLAEFVAKGYLKAESIHTESEASAAASVMGALRAGARSFTATSSQGLWLMAEQIYDTGIRRLPLVMANVNRTMGPPWNILLSHEDSLVLRDIPWVQFYVATAQEALDSIIIAYRTAETLMIPVMVCLDGFYSSHASEMVEVPAQRLVDRFLPKYRPTPEQKIDFKNPHIFEPSIRDECTTEFRYKLMKVIQDSGKTIDKVQEEFEKSFGRKYEQIEKYNLEKAKMAVITLGSHAGTAKEVLKNQDEVGLIRIRTFRPFPKVEIREALKGIEKIAVLERDMQGIIASEIKTALYEAEIKIPVWSFIAGFGGRDITKKTLKNVIEAFKTESSVSEKPVWIDLKKNLVEGEVPLPVLRKKPEIIISKKSFLRGINGEELMTPGEKACQGCGATLALRHILKVLGRKTAMTLPACCFSVINGPFPNCSIRVPLLNVCFEEAAAEASGIKVGLTALGSKKANVLGFAGDGGTYDIGLQALSGAAERNNDIIFVCYDNEAYMNTGIQRSSATPFGAWSTTTPVLKKEFKKDIMAIMAAHRIPYAATASIAFIEDLAQKIKKAKKIQGTKFILVYSPCPTGWRFSPEFSIEVARQAVLTRAFSLYEIENGRKYTINLEPEFRPIEKYLKLQGRFSNLSPEQIREIQKFVDSEWDYLKKLSRI